MPVPDSVKIRHPGEFNTGIKAVPLTFGAAGTAKGDTIKGVCGTVTKHGSGVSTQGKKFYFFEKPGLGNSRYRWMLRFAVTEPGTYRLDVQGVDSADGDIASATDCVASFEVGAGIQAFVQVDYPPEGHDITGDERDYFVAYGSHSVPIRLARLVDPTDTDPPVGEEFISDNLDIPFWSAQFPPLNGVSSPRILEVLDYNNNNDSKNVTIT